MGIPNQEIDTKAEKVMLRHIQRQLRKENAFVHLLRVVTSVANESTTIEEPLQTALDAICALTGWPIGHALLKSPDKEELTSAGLWHLDQPERFETFRKVSEALTFGGGIGLPGRVLKSGAPAWIPDVMADENFPRNRLVRNLGLRSGFACPILVGKEVAGVLEFFHTERVEPDQAILMVMNQVGVQLGRVIERRRAEQTLTSLAQGIAAQQGQNFFASLVNHLTRSAKADYTLIGELKEGRDAVRTLAVSAGGETAPNFDYPLKGTPCEAVINKNFCSHPEGVQEKFPQDKILIDMKVQTYVGTPLFDSSGNVLGLLVALWCRRPANMRVAESMVQIFAVRAAVELERKRAEETAQKLAELPRANPHPVMEFAADGALRFANDAARLLARSMGKEDPIHILPKDIPGIVSRCLISGQNGLVVDKLADERTIIWSFIPIVRNNTVFAHAFELTLFLNLHDELRRMGVVVDRSQRGNGSPRSRRATRARGSKESVH
jgi:GAF domain-containing protein